MKSALERRLPDCPPGLAQEAEPGLDREFAVITTTSNVADVVALSLRGADARKLPR
jgi:hypothetical protein